MFYVVRSCHTAPHALRSPQGLVACPRDYALSVGRHRKVEDSEEGK